MTPLEALMDRLVRAGVSVTYDEFDSLPIEAQEALIAARAHERAEFASMIGTAMQGRAGAAWVMRGADGGDAWVEHHLQEAAERYFRKAASQ